MPKTEFLVVDTSAFIKNTQLQDFSEKVITCQEVVDEIKNSRQLRRLVVLPFDLEIDEPDNEDIVFVSQFSKKTGDYPALSSTDIKVVALTYKLERLKVGKDHLNSQPPAPREIQVIDHSVINDKSIVGFYMPDGNQKGGFEGVEGAGSSDDGEKDEEIRDSSESKDGASDTSDDSQDEFFDTEQEVPEVDDELISRLSEIKVQDYKESGEEECDPNDPCAVDDDDAGWITPSNLKKNILQMYGGTTEEEVTPIKVACLTTDFAMQNVLKQIGLNIVSLDGLLIKQVRTWILRCYACFKTTPDMMRVFCHNCGNKTLKRVAVTVDPDGKEHIHINFRRPLTAKGKRFPIPRFRGGKHSNNPILSEDQRVPQQRLSNLARKKTDALNPDYIAGVSPFIMRDVCSKSAMLGITNKETKSWERRNPNVVVKSNER
uniref:RNA-binding protein NOB1 n=1 Tax=Lygus hesperus TaxID=30085 RepID=A0A146L0L7_LYGHE